MKWVLPPAVLKSPSKDYLDIYIPSSYEHPILRIRRRGSIFEITKKDQVLKGDFSRHIETTIKLTKEEFDELEVLKGKRTLKIRYFYEEKGVSFEVDIFKGKLKGLILVDIEFKNTKEMKNFTPPSWLLVEVTQEEFLAGGMLCGKSYGDIEERLKVFG
ncbi:MAG: hypothetical protein HYT09_00630, partial [Candidatus Levybacteria bacterium]|nr:hypothetical protein [Candidatus Levybacteria bacterium]